MKTHQYEFSLPSPLPPQFLLFYNYYMILSETDQGILLVTNNQKYALAFKLIQTQAIQIITLATLHPSSEAPRQPTQQLHYHA